MDKTKWRRAKKKGKAKARAKPEEPKVAEEPKKPEEPKESAFVPPTEEEVNQFRLMAAIRQGDKTSGVGTAYASVEQLAEEDYYLTGQRYIPYVSMSAVATKHNIMSIRLGYMIPVYRVRLMRLIHRLQILACFTLTEAVEEMFPPGKSLATVEGMDKIRRQFGVLDETIESMKEYVDLADEYSYEKEEDEDERLDREEAERIRKDGKKDKEDQEQKVQ